MSRVGNLLMLKLQCLQFDGSVERVNTESAQSQDWWLFIDFLKCMMGLSEGWPGFSYWTGFRRNLGRIRHLSMFRLQLQSCWESRRAAKRRAGVDGAPCIVDCCEGVGWLDCSYGSA